jgi:LPS-assembly protein
MRRNITALLLFALCSLLPYVCYAAEPPMVIEAETLEYDKNTGIYTATGFVKVEQGDITIEADEIIYYENTGDAFLSGDVSYDTSSITLIAEKAEYNIKTKQGKFYNAEISAKQDSFYITAAEIEKKDENKYFIKEASFTTCDNLPPDWCLKGKNIDITIGDRVKAKNVTFNILDTPVLYSPYIWAPVLTERQTGLLTPTFGYSKQQGFSYRQPFFWAISDEKDATFTFDWFAKKGIGEGVEYRYVDIGNVSGKNWIYHTHNTKTGKDYFEINSANEKRSADSLSSYLNFNYVNNKNFYREYSTDRDDRVKRFLESTGELSYPQGNSRIYLMSQYLRELKDESDSKNVAQRLPEFGYVTNPYAIGPAYFSLTSSASNFWREHGVWGQRVDVHPKLSYSFGDKIILSQNLGLRETLYSLKDNETSGYKDSINREVFDYTITSTGRLLKKYGSFSHAIEPSLGYTYIPWVGSNKANVPVFDSVDLYSKKSAISLNLMNRLMDSKGEFLTFNISESYDTNNGNTPFSPVSLLLALARPIQIKGDATYNMYTGKYETVNTSGQVNLFDAVLSFSRRYNAPQNLLVYDLGASYPLSKSLSTDANLWYDARNNEHHVRDITLKINYKKQCWKMALIYNKQPDDYKVLVTFDLLGFGSVK